MTGESDLPTGAGGARDPGEDTVELELTAAEQHALAEADRAAPRSLEIVPDKLGHDAFVYRRTERIDLVCTLTFVALILGFTAAVGWRALVGRPTVPAVAIAALTPLTLASAAPTASIQPQRPPLQVINPFDATEVFELPAETTDAQARDAVAELLLQRANERHRQGLVLRRANNRPQPPAIAPADPSDTFVTRLSGSVDQFAGAPEPAR